jgi:hypothetical protein
LFKGGSALDSDVIGIRQDCDHLGLAPCSGATACCSDRLA